MQVVPTTQLATSLKRKRRVLNDIFLNALRLRFRLVSPIVSDRFGDTPGSVDGLIE
jgi:hypothetical protein